MTAKYIILKVGNNRNKTMYEIQYLFDKTNLLHLIPKDIPPQKAKFGIFNDINYVGQF